jgi:hypothetical protein
MSDHARRAPGPLRRNGIGGHSEVTVHDETFNLEIRKFLKQFGVTAQREIERGVAAARGAGTLKGNETLKTRAVLTVEGLGTLATIDGDIRLE